MAEWIGKIKQINGEWYQCVEGKTTCDECDLRNIICQKVQSMSIPFKECSRNYRTDKKNVIFKKLEKVGEPFYSKYFGKFYQMYRTYIPAVGSNFKVRVTPVEYVGRNEIFIEIKQNQKDMQEKKLNLKPFNIQEAREGKPVCTRDGRRARIICFDLKNEEYPIVAAIGNDSSETLLCYTINGEIIKGNYKSEKDLMMLPEKRKGWINIHQYDVYKTKEEAEGKVFDKANYLTTIEIEYWR